MATIPVYSTPQAGAGSAPGPAYFNPGTAPAADAIGARQLQGAGDALMGAGSQVASIAAQMQREVDNVLLTDAEDQARQQVLDLTYGQESGYARLKGVEALRRPDKQFLPDEFAGKLQARLDTIEGELSTDYQRQQFRMRAASLKTEFHGRVMAHALGEFKAHRLSVQDGTLKIASEEARQGWSDPSIVAQAVGRVRTAVEQKGMTIGWSATETEAAALAATSAVHADVILQALAAGNSGYASGYLESRREQMTADDILKVRGHVQKAEALGQAQAAVQQTAQHLLPRMAPTRFDVMVDITAQTESGNRDIDQATGAVITSPKGAKGRMQVLDTTMRAPGLPGVQPLDPKTATLEERARFGQQYLQALLQRYGGDPAKAWAAYNGGFGRVDRALREAAEDAPKFRGQAPADLWLQKLPEETRNYVRKNLAALGGGYSPAPVTEAEFVAAAVQRLPEGAAPEAVRVTQETAARQFGSINRGREQLAEASVSAAQRWLASNRGAGIDQLPAELYDAVMLHAPGKARELKEYARALDSDEVRTDLVVYNRLAGNPELLRRMSDADFEAQRARLSPADFKHFATQRGKLLNPSPSDAKDPGNLDTTSLNTIIGEHLRTLNQDPTPSKTDAVARMGAMRKFVAEAVLRAQAAAGRRFDQSELRKQVDELFAMQTTIDQFFGPDIAVSALTVSSADDIPEKTRKSLQKDFAGRGINKPTDAQLLGAYWSAMHQTRIIRSMQQQQQGKAKP